MWHLKHVKKSLRSNGILFLRLKYESGERYEEDFHERKFL